MQKVCAGVQLITGASVSTTVIVCVCVVVFPQASVTVHVLVIVPQPSVTLLVSTKSTVSVWSQLSVAVIVGTAGRLSQSACTWGGVACNPVTSLSRTATFCLCDVVFPQASVTV